MNDDQPNQQHDLKIPDAHHHRRLDQALAALLPQYSRSRIQQWIKQGCVSYNDVVNLHPDTQVASGDAVCLTVILSAQTPLSPQNIPLDIIHEDSDVLVINKPIGLIVHPGSGNPDSTLVNALLHYDHTLEHLPRAGIIHRLDKDTSGTLLIARNLNSYTQLNKAMQAREIHRHYAALVYGEIISGATIQAKIGRHPQKRTHMAITPSGRDAITHYRIHQRYAHFTLLDVQLETGRTHQIRVHMQHIRHPIVGDATYSRLRFPKDCDEQLKSALSNFNHQALHAKTLSFIHPRTQESVSCSAPMPMGFCTLLDLIARYTERIRS